MDTHFCRKCQTNKPVEYFYKNQRICRPCHKEAVRECTTKREALDPNDAFGRMLKKKGYWVRLSWRECLAAYQAISEKQGHVCAICGGVDQNRRLAVDHNHETGNVRGLLCLRCNIHVIGTLETYPELIDAGKIYLLKHSK